ncbi:MAG: phosphoglucomutase/phosphomannomutase family protein, partial [Elusimicrobiota bacterium]
MPRRLSRPALAGRIKFGTDGWRGIIADDFTFDNVRIVAQAVADYIRLDAPRSGGRKPSVVVGYDCRFLSGRFALAAAQTLRANGISVALSAEVVPTPVVSLLTRKRFSLGIMITASHNPPRYNGFKIKVGGRSSPEAVTAAVEARLGRTRPLFDGDIVIPTRSFKPDYFRYLKSRVSVPGILAGLQRPVVIDCMHGAGSGLAAELLPSKKVLTIRDRHDPDFGGVHPEPIACNLEALSQAVKRFRAM